jgi:hypothetical protein
MKYTFHRTKDQRHFKYGIQVLTMIDFHNTRKWLVESYGYGVDIDKLESLDGVDKEIRWGYVLRYLTYMFYLRNDEEFAWFRLKFQE